MENYFQAKKKLFDMCENSVINIDSKSGERLFKNIKSFKTLVSDKEAYYREYDEWPVKIKPNAKLSDLLDISKFKNLKYITIHDSKMYIIFENTALSDSMTKTVFNTMLRCKGNTIDSIKPYIPVTADGWRVFVSKY